MAALAAVGLLAAAESAAAITTSHLTTDAQLTQLLPTKLFVAEGRIGDRSGHATFELDIGQDTNAPVQTADYN